MTMAGVIRYDKPLTPAQVDAMRREWQSMYEAPNGRVATLFGGTVDASVVWANSIESVGYALPLQPLRVTCDFCGSSVVMPDNGKCPNCGAVL